MAFLPLLTFAGVITGSLTAPAGQTAARSKPAPMKPGFSMQSEWRLRYEARNDQDFQAGGNDPRDLLSRLRLGLRYTLDNGNTLFLQPQYALGRDTNYPKATGTTHDLDIHQGYADLRGAGRVNVRVGRQELLFGDARLLGNGNWSNVGRSWDAVRATIPGRRSSTELLLAKLGQSASKTNEPTIMGLYSTLNPASATVVDLYFLRKSVRVTGATSQEVFTTGTRAAYRRGPFDATAEAVYQFGNNEGRGIDAWAYAAVAGYRLPGPWSARLFAETDFATGGNPTGSGTYRTFDHLYPTNHQHYGLIDYVGWRNMRDIRLGLQAKPTAKLQTTLDGHFFSLANSRDFWYSDNGRPMLGAAGTGLRDPSGAAGKDLGREFDATATYALSRTTSVSAGYARFMPGSFVKKVNGSGKTSDWFFLYGLLQF